MQDLLKRLRTRLTERECFCQNLATGIVLFYGIFMFYVFPREWVDTPQAIALIKAMYPIVPMLRLMLHSPLYTNFWGVFYSVFWLLIWIFPILGFMSVFLLDKSKWNFIKEQPIGFPVMGEFMFGVFCLWMFAYPMIGARPYLDELSNNFLVLQFTIWAIAMCFYMLGFGLGKLQIKFLLRNE